MPNTNITVISVEEISRVVEDVVVQGDYEIACYCGTYIFYSYTCGHWHTRHHYVCGAIWRVTRYGFPGPCVPHPDRHFVWEYQIDEDCARCQRRRRRR